MFDKIINFLLNDLTPNDTLVITPTTILMWFLGVFLVLLAIINGFLN